MLKKKHLQTIALIGAGIAGLAACSDQGSDPLAGGQPTALPESSGDGGEDAAKDSSDKEPLTDVEFASTAWLAVGRDGDVLTTFLDPGGRYRDYQNGKLAASGQWDKGNDNEICFAPQSAAPKCWVMNRGRDEDTRRAETSDGRAIELEQIAYRAPEEENAPEAEPSQEGGE